MKTRREHAVSAFWGGNAELMAEVEDRRGYEMDGVWYLANGVTLAECIETVEALDVETWAELEALGIVE